jgi:hypothetical protein
MPNPFNTPGGREPGLGVRMMQAAMESIIWLPREKFLQRGIILAKKAQENDLVKTVVSTASKYLFESIFGKINEELRLILGTVEARGYQMQERMLERLFSFITLVLAGIFIVLGVHSVLREYLKLTDSMAYLLVGAALLAAYYLMNQRQQFGKKIEGD